MSNVISALLKRPGEIPRHVNVSNSLEALQKNVEGYFETISFYALEKDFLIICNEEGLIKDMPYNCTIYDQPFVGPILIVGRKGTEFADLPVDWKTMKKLFPNLWEVPHGD